MIIVNTVVLTRSVLGGSEIMTTVFLACAGAGSMCAAFLIPKVIDQLGERRLMLSGIVFAAGAMLYVISHEIIPETHRSGHQKKATLGLSIGLVLMLFLDVSLG